MMRIALRLWLHRLAQSHHGRAVKSIPEEDWGQMAEEESITLGHMRSHACRDLLVYCAAIDGNSQQHYECGPSAGRLAHPLVRSLAWCVRGVGIGELMFDRTDDR